MIKHSQGGGPPAPMVRGVGPGARPLSHHEILTLMGPFSRRGRHADLPACRRSERRLVFAPVIHPPPARGLPAVRDVLSLEARETGWFRLVRNLTAAGPGAGLAPLSASLTAAGRDLDALLAQVDAVSPGRQLLVSSGVCLERSYRLPASAASEAGEEEPSPVLIRARAVVQGVTLDLDADHSAGLPVQLRLIPPPGRRLEIPQDLLAVLGSDWRPLQDRGDHWTASIRVVGEEPGRTADVEAKLARTVEHLEATLAGRPAEFHPRHQEARWRVLRRRLVPALMTLGLGAAVPAMALSPAVETMQGRLLLFQSAALIVLGVFAFTDPPLVEIPRLPRNLSQEQWLVEDR